MKSAAGTDPRLAVFARVVRKECRCRLKIDQMRVDQLRPSEQFERIVTHWERPMLRGWRLDCCWTHERRHEVYTHLCSCHTNSPRRLS